MRMLRVYTAAKTDAAAELQAIAAVHPFLHFHARWLKHIYHGTLETAGNARLFWQENEEDIKSADCCLVYGINNTDILRGALVEAGIAIANHVQVICVGDHPSFGTWQYHPGVIRVKTLDDALKWLNDAAYF